MAWKIMYVVKVKLMRLTDTPRSSAMGFKAGKYMLAVMGETKLAQAAMAMIHRFVGFEKAL
jgi:hypothetical protein